MTQISVKRIPEIEGLRAIAVISVVLFHAKINIFSGGYIGVDVFFVISGYLITKVLWTELVSHNEINLVHFYAKRIARLAPALAVVSLSFSSIFSFLFPPVISESISTSFILAQISISNFWFYFNTNYFSESAINPALHTWSLGVEEQFYIVLPLLLLLLYGWNSKRVIYALVGLTSCSFIFAVWVIFDSPTQAFYFPWLRAWELLFGSILALNSIRLRKGAIAQLLTLSGLVGIGFGCVWYSEHTLFPGVSAGLPVLATAMVIATSGQQNLANRLLALQPMQWLGKISYSVYLVHWPLVCIASSTVSLYPKSVRVAVVFGSILLGWMSWRWIESPFRVRLNCLAPSRVLGGFVLCNIAICTCIYISAKAGQQYWSRFPNAVALSSHIKGPTDFFRTGLCFLDGSPGGPSQIPKSPCITPNLTDDNILLMGDSHAANLWSALQTQNPSKHLLQATASGCRPLLHSEGGTPWCTDMNRYLFKEWIPYSSDLVSTVILAGRWNLEEIPLLIETVRFLRNSGKKVIVIGPTPEYFIAVPLMLAYEDVLGSSLQSYMLKRDRIFLDSEIKNAMQSESVLFYSMIENLCHSLNVNPACLTIVDHIPMWSDRNHFTKQGSNFIVSKFKI